MAFIGKGTETYLLLTGIQTDTPVKLGANTELLPATCHLGYDEFASLMKHSYIDFAVGFLVIPSVRSQLHITAENTKELSQNYAGATIAEPDFRFWKPDSVVA